MTIGADGRSRREPAGTGLRRRGTSSTRDRSSQDADPLAIATGKSPSGRLPMSVSGMITGIGQAYKTLAVHGDGTVIQPGGALVYVWSSVASDTAEGTGLQAVYLDGIEKDTFARVSETVATGGTTEQVSTNQYEAVNYSKGGAVGSDGTQNGTISIGSFEKGNAFQTIAPSTDPDGGEVQQAWFMVPAGFDLVLDQAVIWILDTTAKGGGRVQVKEDGAAWRTIGRWTIAAGKSPVYDFRDKDAIPAKARVRLQGIAADETDTMLGRLTGTLVPV